MIVKVKAMAIDTPNDQFVSVIAVNGEKVLVELMDAEGSLRKISTKDICGLQLNDRCSIDFKLTGSSHSKFGDESSWRGVS